MPRSFNPLTLFPPSPAPPSPTLSLLHTASKHSDKPFFPSNPFHYSFLVHLHPEIYFAHTARDQRRSLPGIFPKGGELKRDYNESFYFVIKRLYIKRST